MSVARYRKTRTSPMSQFTVALSRAIPLHIMMITLVLARSGRKIRDKALPRELFMDTYILGDSCHRGVCPTHSLGTRSKLPSYF